MPTAPAPPIAEPADVIVASAGVTHPPLSWIGALKPGGRLLFPMTSERGGPGRMLLVTRRTQNGFAARFLCDVRFIDFKGMRDPEASARLAQALKRDGGASVMSLRCDDHKEDKSCWLHGGDWCPLAPRAGARANSLAWGCLGSNAISDGRHWLSAHEETVNLQDRETARRSIASARAVAATA